MKYYKGKRLNPEEKTGSEVEIWIEDEKNGITKGKLKHHKYHSPDGHSWGYHGSGPAELAKDILWDYFGKKPTNLMYQTFKDDFVAKCGDTWSLSEMGIDNWVIGTWGRECLDKLKERKSVNMYNYRK